MSRWKFILLLSIIAYESCALSHCEKNKSLSIQSPDEIPILIFKKDSLCKQHDVIFYLNFF